MTPPLPKTLAELGAFLERAVSQEPPAPPVIPADPIPLDLSPPEPPPATIPPPDPENPVIAAEPAKETILDGPLVESLDAYMAPILAQPQTEPLPPPPEPKQTAFAKRLRSARKSAGMTQTELASMLKVDVRTLIRWELSDSLPSMPEQIGVFTLLERYNAALPAKEEAP